MSKFDNLKYLKETKSRAIHFCNKCGNTINIGEIYYKETIDDKFLHSLNSKKFCLDCFIKFSDNLIK